MLSSAATKPKTSMLLAPPPGAAGKLRSPLPPPPNDPAAARMNSGHNAGIRAPTESTKRNNDPISDLSAIKVRLSNWCLTLVSIVFHDGELRRHAAVHAHTSQLHKLIVKQDLSCPAYPFYSSW